MCPASSRPRGGAEQAEVAETVLSALQRLPMSPCVSPVVLRYYADLSERDIALAIGRRPGTVKSRLHEARRRLAADHPVCPRRGRAGPTAEQPTLPKGPNHDHARRRPPRLPSSPEAGAALEVPAAGADDILAWRRGLAAALAATSLATTRVGGGP